jgi:tetratricopeptide (TPR) repeat protein
MPADKHHDDANEKKSVHSTPVPTLVKQYRSIADQLQQSEDLEDAEDALSPITNESVPTQIEFLKALTNEHTTAAADIAQALNTLSDHKEVRKEARRSLVQLEKDDIFAEWQAPSGPTISQALEQITNRSNEDGNALISDLQSLLAGAENFFVGSVYTDTVSDFLGEWVEGNYEEAYDFLSNESSLREKLEQADWSERRSQWNLEAHTDKLLISFIESLADEDGQELPIVDVGWSIELNEEAPIVALTELPQSTATLPETGRHWFWTRYTLVQEDEEWLIEDMSDIGANILQSSIPEIQEHIERLQGEIDQLGEEIAEDEDDEDELDDVEDEDLDEDEDEEDEDEDDLEDDDLLGMMENTSSAIQLAAQIMYYYDALISKTQDVEADTYKNLVERALLTTDIERAAYYAKKFAEKIPESRGEALENLAVIYLMIAEHGHENDDHEQEHQLIELAETTLRDAIEAAHRTKSMILLANILLRQEDNLDEAEELLHTAEGNTHDEDEMVSIELGLGEIAFSRDQKEHALAHYQNAARVNEDDAELWYRIGYLQSQLHNSAQAISALQKCIQLEPTYTDAYTELAGCYIEQGNTKQARETVRRGIDINPDSADLRASMALVYLQSNILSRPRLLIVRSTLCKRRVESMILVHRKILALPGPTISQSIIKRSDDTDRNTTYYLLYRYAWRAYTCRSRARRN